MGDTPKTRRKKTGRPPTEYSSAVVAVLDGYEGPGTVTELCEILNVSSTVFYRWLKDEQEFNDAVMRVRERADQMVENALFKRAIGYNLDRVVTMDEDGSGESGAPVNKHRTTHEVVHVPPDVAAQRFWLMNRQRDKWTERKEIALTGDHAEMVEKFLKEQEG